MIAAGAGGLSTPVSVAIAGNVITLTEASATPANNTNNTGDTFTVATGGGPFVEAAPTTATLSNVLLGTAATDVITVGSGGGVITLGNGGAWNPNIGITVGANTFYGAYDVGSETVNLTAAKALGLTIPGIMLASADEIIE